MKNPGVIKADAFGSRLKAALLWNMPPSADQKNMTEGIVH